MRDQWIRNIMFRSCQNHSLLTVISIFKSDMCEHCDICVEYVGLWTIRFGFVTKTCVPEKHCAIKGNV